MYNYLMFLILIYLMSSNVEHLHMYLLAIYTYTDSWIICLNIVSLILVGDLSLCCLVESVLYVFWIQTFCQVFCTANIFSQCVAYIFIVLIVTFEAQILKINSNLSFFLLICAFLCIVLKILSYHKVMMNFCVFFYVFILSF